MNPFLSRAVAQYMAAVLVVLLICFFYIGWSAIFAWLLAAAGFLVLGRAWAKTHDQRRAGEKLKRKLRRPP